MNGRVVFFRVGSSGGVGYGGGVSNYTFFIRGGQGGWGGVANAGIFFGFFCGFKRMGIYLRFIFPVRDLEGCYWGDLLDDITRDHNWHPQTKRGGANPGGWGKIGGRGERGGVGDSRECETLIPDTRSRKGGGGLQIKSTCHHGNFGRYGWGLGEQVGVHQLIRDHTQICFRFFFFSFTVVPRLSPGFFQESKRRNLYYMPKQTWAWGAFRGTGEGAGGR